MSTKTATVYRMVMPDHLCPYGLKTVDLLKREGFAVEENARAETLSSVSRDEESLRGMPTKTRRRLAVTRRISPELRFEGCQLFV